MEEIILKCFQVGDLDTNCYIFGDKNSREVVVVDPGGEGERIHNFIEGNNYKVKYIILTHGHFDHIREVKYLKQLTEALVLIHKFDAEMLIDPQKNLSAYVMPLDLQSIQVQADKFVENDEELTIGNKVFKILHTPGHTMGSICILFDNNLFSGDTLFKESIGRTDLPNSSYSDILDSVKRLMSLDDSIKVYPGHGESSTIQHEKKCNPFVK